MPGERPLRILLSIHHRLDRDSGAAGVVMRIAEEYRLLGHQARVLSHDDLPPWARDRAGFLFPLLLARQVTRWRPDVVDASSGDGWLAFSQGMPARPLCVTHSHGLEHLSSASEIEEAASSGRRLALAKRLWRHGLRLKLVARSFAAADLALVLNDAEATCLEQRLGVAADAIERIALGTDHAGVPIRVSGRAPAGVVQIGAYSRRKGVQVTARAMTAILGERADATLTFIGTGVPRETVLADYPAHLHGRIEVVLRYANAQLPALLEPHSICLMPSLFEGYGISKIEAMACGLAVVTSDDGGACADVVDGVNGLVVPRGDATALAAAVRRLFDDPQEAAALARTSRITAAERSWATVAQARLALYRKHARSPAGVAAPVQPKIRRGFEALPGLARD
ncbi:glycosyltransferase family 4 protein [Sphingomonas sp. PL-96]|uniref:glycosyltransferase family 4 protein n=1 Tax=Sphingomonas sp. PL-96 TaxID=2887201 RepID=UPI001E368C52|nr:glycosyltransferase family 4 protein [Sphingomonas sp. PL-96]MCC2975168.1 glycosyltransferase family 4 protein [Sphingomonas sp. PL-96]